MKEVAAAFVAAQKAFAPLIRNSENPHRNSKYADLSACFDAVQTALNEQGIAIVQRTHDSDTGVKVETLFVHTSGESISSGLLHVPAPKQDPQGYGSALTYARRYSLMTACGIAPEDDDGNAASVKPKPKARSLEELMKIIKTAQDAGENWKVLYSEMNTEEQKIVSAEIKRLKENAK